MTWCRNQGLSLELVHICGCIKPVNGTSTLFPFGSCISTDRYKITTVNMYRNPLKPECEFRCSRAVSNSCSTIGTHRIIPVTNPVINHWVNGWIVIRTNVKYSWIFVILIHVYTLTITYPKHRKQMYCSTSGTRHLWY